MRTSQEIWEGWTVQDFIDDLEPMFDMVMNNEAMDKPFKTRDELKNWLIDNQPHYKKFIPAVFYYFAKKANL